MERLCPVESPLKCSTGKENDKWWCGNALIRKKIISYTQFIPGKNTLILSNGFWFGKAFKFEKNVLNNNCISHVNQNIMIISAKKKKDLLYSG